MEWLWAADHMTSHPNLSCPSSGKLFSSATWWRLAVERGRETIQKKYLPFFISRKRESSCCCCGRHRRRCCCYSNSAIYAQFHKKYCRFSACLREAVKLLGLLSLFSWLYKWQLNHWWICMILHRSLFRELDECVHWRNAHFPFVWGRVSFSQQQNMNLLTCCLHSTRKTGFTSLPWLFFPFIAVIPVTQLNQVVDIKISHVVKTSSSSRMINWLHPAHLQCKANAICAAWATHHWLRSPRFH